jgi:hypothetical protein
MIYKNDRITKDLIKKVISSSLYIIDMQEKRNGADYIIKKIHVKQ